MVKFWDIATPSVSQGSKLSYLHWKSSKLKNRYAIEPLKDRGRPAAANRPRGRYTAAAPAVAPVSVDHGRGRGRYGKNRPRPRPRPNTIAHHLRINFLSCSMMKNNTTDDPLRQNPRISLSKQVVELRHALSLSTRQNTAREEKDLFLLKMQLLQFVGFTSSTSATPPSDGFLHTHISSLAKTTFLLIMQNTMNLQIYFWAVW